METKKLTLTETMENLGLSMKLETNDIVAMVVTKRQAQYQAEKDELQAKISEIDKLINDSAFNEMVQLTIDKFMADFNLTDIAIIKSYRTDYHDNKAELSISLTFNLPTTGLDEIIKLRKEKQPELSRLNGQLRILNEKMNNVKAMERETRAQLAELKLREMGQDILIDSLVTPLPIK